MTRYGRDAARGPFTACADNACGNFRAPPPLRKFFSWSQFHARIVSADHQSGEISNSDPSLSHCRRKMVRIAS
jgi:hypothetical protein